MITGRRFYSGYLAYMGEILAHSITKPNGSQRTRK